MSQQALVDLQLEINEAIRLLNNKIVALGESMASLAYLPLAGGTMDASAPVNFNSGALSNVNSMSVKDNAWVGLGSGAGRIEFDDQTKDEINFLNCRIGVGTSTPATTAAVDLSGMTAERYLVYSDRTLASRLGNTAPLYIDEELTWSGGPLGGAGSAGIVLNLTASRSITTGSGIDLVNAFNGRAVRTSTEALTKNAATYGLYYSATDTAGYSGSGNIATITSGIFIGSTRDGQYTMTNKNASVAVTGIDVGVVDTATYNIGTGIPTTTTYGTKVAVTWNPTQTAAGTLNAKVYGVYADVDCSGTSWGTSDVLLGVAGYFDVSATQDLTDTIIGLDVNITTTYAPSVSVGIDLDATGSADRGIAIDGFGTGLDINLAANSGVIGIDMDGTSGYGKGITINAILSAIEITVPNDANGTAMKITEAGANCYIAIEVSGFGWALKCTNGGGVWIDGSSLLIENSGTDALKIDDAGLDASGADAFMPPTGIEASFAGGCGLVWATDISKLMFKIGAATHYFSPDP